MMPALGRVRQLMTRYCSYYERSRTHLALHKDAPVCRPVMPAGDGAIVAIPAGGAGGAGRAGSRLQVGGLHHRYERRAA